jgi:hypothetical protein
MANSRLIQAFLLIACVSCVIGHSYVTSPTSRSNQKQSESGCRGPNCLGPCDAPLSSTSRTAAVTIARGASINVQWPRNNHAGGFIRLSWTLTSGSDIHANFDAGVQEIVCHENGGCYPDDPNAPNGGDSGPADGSSRACSTTITVPLYLSDGAWTLQWAWFGGAFALGDYYSCVDYIIAGGPTGPKLDAVFKGGDYTYPGQNKCKFFNTDRLHQCVNEPCNNPVYPASQEESGPAYGFSTVVSQPLTTSSVKPLTSASVIPLTTSIRPLTTSARPLSTGSVKPITSGRVSPVTTGRMSLTTGKKVTIPSTTGMVVTQSSSINCAGLTNEITSADIEVVAVDTWSNVFRMEIKVSVNEPISNWMLQVIFPDEATDTEVEIAYNAGELKCSATAPTRHAMISPVAQWANTMKAGEDMYIELTATNTNMNSAFITSNTQFKLFTQ